MTDYVQLSTTTGSADVAQQIASVLVEQRLAACVQIIPQVRSVYRWQDKVEQSDEWLCLVKTRRALVAEVEATILQLHSYDCPEIIVVAVELASKEYSTWLDQQLQ